MHMASEKTRIYTFWSFLYYVKHACFQNHAGILKSGFFLGGIYLYYREGEHKMKKT